MPSEENKNRVYVKKHKDKKKQEIGLEEFNKRHALETRQYREKAREEDEEAFKLKNKEYMKQYREKKKAEKNAIKNQTATILQNAIRNKLARKKLLEAKKEKANEITTSVNKKREAQMKNKLIASAVSNDMLNNIFPQVVNKLPTRARRNGRNQ
jgi:hypothetical protein